ncbi:MAG TPA: zinc ribbon domain-containing protein [Terriglobia bacterium]|nr:zinc ribbon domain-containing protein [Terriglobia bacterium]
MYCMNCGASWQAGQAFCSACGKPVQAAAQPVPQAAPPPMTQPVTPSAYQPPPYVQPAARGRIAAHLRTLAILWLVVSGLHLVSGLRLFTLGHLGIPFMPFSFASFSFAPFFTPLLSALGALAMVSAVVGLVVGWALLQREPWGRVFAIIMAIIILPRIPFGTALGIYTLWVLVPADSEAEYRQITRPA